jgi:hypothetical protein
MRGVEAEVGTVDSLIRKLRDDDRKRSTLLAEPSFRQFLIGKWLERVDGDGHTFDEDELNSLSANPPLLFFILFEAAHEHKGARLGILGSAIVAEVFFTSLLLSQPLIELDPAIAPPRVQFSGGREISVSGGTDLVGRIFGGSVPRDMPDLIRFIKENGGLGDIAYPPPPA